MGGMPIGGYCMGMGTGIGAGPGMGAGRGACDIGAGGYSGGWGCGTADGGCGCGCEAPDVCDVGGGNAPRGSIGPWPGGGWGIMAWDAA